MSLHEVKNDIHIITWPMPSGIEDIVMEFKVFCPECQQMLGEYSD